MPFNDVIKEDLKTLEINEEQNLTERFVNAKFKRRARKVHPDKPGGNTQEFQELQNAFKRIIKYIQEEAKKEEDEVEEDVNYETQFFMKHNFMKKCSDSYVVYLQETSVDKWKKVLERNMGIYRSDKIKIIYKTGGITLTLYEKPKKDPRSKLHIQSGNQNKNLEFILETLSLFYKEVCETKINTEVGYQDLMRCLCVKCGKTFTSKRGLKQHILRMHDNKKAKQMIEQSIGTADTSQKPKLESITIIETPIVPKENRPLEQHKENTEARQIEEDGDNNDFINNIVEKLLDNFENKEPIQTTKEVESNFQCGVCGKLFKTEEDSEKHIEVDHKERQRIHSEGYKKEIKELTEELEGKNEFIKTLVEKTENLVKKNVSLDKESRRFEMAFKECMVEKEELKKDMN